MRPAPEAAGWLDRLSGIAAVAAPSGLGFTLFGWIGALGGGAVGLAAVAGFRLSRERRKRQRHEILAEPFPTEWRRVLEDRYDHYHRLSEAWRGRFEDGVRLFLATKRITGVGIAPTLEHRLLIAASAVTLSTGWDGYEWDQLAEVLLYPDDFDRDYGTGGDRAGETHVWGTVILSTPALDESFDDPEDGYHVGLHEFAHLLDLDASHFSGLPAGLDRRLSSEWTAVAEAEMQRLRAGRRSAFDDYGAHDPVEFLAVAVEAFFETPRLVRRHHARVYDILAAYFGQDPAAWDDETDAREA